MMSRSELKFNRAYILAVIVIILCLISITGATLAIFTSDGEDGKIGINATSGQLKVDIVDSLDTSQSLVGEVLSFVADKVETKVYFEPGATYYTEGFRVKNIGTVPLDFILYISEDKTLEADFYDAFEVWITTNPDEREGMNRLEDFDGALASGEVSDVFYLVFRMKDTAGNDFQDRAFLGIGVTVCAVQGNVNID